MLINEGNLGKYVCLLPSDKPTSYLLTSYICFLILISMSYKFLTKKFNISCSYIVATIRGVKVKQRFYDLGLYRAPPNLYVDIYSFKNTESLAFTQKSMLNMKKIKNESTKPYLRYGTERDNWDEGAQSSLCLRSEC